MTIKEIFEQATTENKSLTYEEFNRLAGVGKAKFTDLAEGKYVDKQKYLDDISAKDVTINGLNDTIGTRDKDLEELKAQLESAGTNQEELAKLTESLSALQGKYDSDTQALQSKLDEQAYSFAVRDFSSTLKFSSAAAKRDFERQMTEARLPMVNGNIMGAKDWKKEFEKDNADSFVKEPKQTPGADNKPQFAGAANGQGTNNTKLTLTELMKMKNANPDAAISFD